MQQPCNQTIEDKSLPNLFGKCLGIEPPDPQSIHIRSPQYTPRKEVKEAEILAYARKNLPLKAPLQTDDRGFLYVKLPDSYIYELSPFLEGINISHPPYFDQIYSAGAHITVVLASENHPPLPLEVFATEIPFTLTGCYCVEPENWPVVETVWFLTVDAPKLSDIRTQLSLSPKIQGHEFHITFAVKNRFLSIEDLLSSSQDKQSIVIKSLSK